MESFSQELSTIVLGEGPANLKLLSEQMDREDFVKYILNIKLYYRAIAGIGNYTYLGACYYDFVTYDVKKAGGIDPLGHMKHLSREIPRRNKMSKDDWDRHRLVGEMIQIVESSQKTGDDSTLTHFVHEIDELSSKIGRAFGTAYAWADRDNEPWEKALDTATCFFEMDQNDISELYTKTKSYFNVLTPRTQREVTAWLGDFGCIGDLRFRKR